jgi:hypothetical protein
MPSEIEHPRRVASLLAAPTRAPAGPYRTPDPHGRSRLAESAGILPSAFGGSASRVSTLAPASILAVAATGAAQAALFLPGFDTGETAPFRACIRGELALLLAGVLAYVSPPYPWSPG